MSYHQKQFALSGTVGPAWYRAMSGMGGVPARPARPAPRVMQAMGGGRVMQAMGGGRVMQAMGGGGVMQAMGGVTSQPPGRYVQRSMGYLGSLGDDDPVTTLSDPTVADPSMPTAQWQAQVLTQLQAGVKTLQTAEIQKWLQIVATVSIPLSAAIWKMIFKKGAKVSDPTT